MRILIVDDERMISEWMQYCIEKHPDCQVVGCAKNGEEALELFRKMTPDVVFTDIKMPVMDGIELLKQVKKESPETVVILLTAFEEFDLAREALRHGCDDYLLKTEMNSAYFQEVLTGLVRQVAESGLQIRPGEQEETEGQKRLIIRNILQSRSVLSEEDVEQLGRCNVHWREGDLFAVAVWRKEMLKSFEIPMNHAVHHVAGYEYNNEYFVFVGNLIKGMTEFQKYQTIHEYASAIAVRNDCEVGLSSLLDSLKQVPDVVAQAVYGLSIGYYSERKECGYVQARKNRVWESNQSGEQIRRKTVLWKKEFSHRRRELHDLPSNCYEKGVETILRECQVQMAIPITEFTALCCEMMEIAFMRFADEASGFLGALLQEEKREVMEAVAYEEVHRHVTEFIHHIQQGQEVDESKLSKSVMEAVKYMRKHYSEPISLESVSAEVHLKTDYLSRIFKEETGMNYTAFLAEIRLKKAAYLLNNTSERVQEIGKAVGYPNVSYFSTTFKKRFGLNPYEFRRKG